MSVFNISFRIGENGDYSSRYNSVVARIRAEATGSSWEETTSFFVIESGSTAANLAQSIYINSELNREWDKLLVVNLSIKDHATVGTLAYPTTLSNLMAKR